MSADPTLFDDLDTDPRVISRRSDPSTSAIAAARVAPRTGTQKAKLLAAFRAAWPNGLTDDEAGDAIGLPPISTRKRCSDLRNDGFIEPVDVVPGRHGTPVRRCVYVWGTDHG